MVRSARDLAWPDLIWSHFSRSRFGQFDEREEAAAKAGFDAIGLYAFEYRRLRDEEGRSPADIRAPGRGPRAGDRRDRGREGMVEPAGPGGRRVPQGRGPGLRDGGRVRLPVLPGRRLAEGDPAELGPAFAALCDRAGAHGLLVGIEFLPFTCVRDAADAKVLIDAARPPERGCCVDIWHYTAGPPTKRSSGSRDRFDRIMAVQMNDGPPGPNIDDYYNDWPRVPLRVRVSSTRPAPCASSPTSGCERRSRSRSARPRCGPVLRTKRLSGRTDGMRLRLAGRPSAREGGSASGLPARAPW